MVPLDKSGMDEATIGRGKAQLSPSKETLWETSGLTNPIPKPSWREKPEREQVHSGFVSLYLIWAMCYKYV
jgi:hypothetical protein